MEYRVGENRVLSIRRRTPLSDNDRAEYMYNNMYMLIRLTW